MFSTDCTIPQLPDIWVALGLTVRYFICFFCVLRAISCKPITALMQVLLLLEMMYVPVGMGEGCGARVGLTIIVVDGMVV